MQSNETPIETNYRLQITFNFHVDHQIVLQVAENVAQNESFVLSKVTPASKVPPFEGNIHGVKLGMSCYNCDQVRSVGFCCHSALRLWQRPQDWTCLHVPSWILITKPSKTGLNPWIYAQTVFVAIMAFGNDKSLISGYGWAGSQPEWKDVTYVMFSLIGWYLCLPWIGKSSWLSVGARL